MKCLIVEDDQFVRMQMEFLLKGLAEIETAADGKEGVQVFARALGEQRPFDLVLLDVIMPELDGQKALKLMREAERAASAEKKTVIVMTTALTSVDDMREALLDGDCTDYLVKPVGKDDLMAVLRRNDLL